MRSVCSKKRQGVFLVVAVLLLGLGVATSLLEGSAVGKQMRCLPTGKELKAYQLTCGDRSITDAAAKNQIISLLTGLETVQQRLEMERFGLLVGETRENIGFTFTEQMEGEEKTVYFVKFFIQKNSWQSIAHTGTSQSWG